MSEESTAVASPVEAVPAPDRAEPPGWLTPLNVSTSWGNQLVSIAGSLVVTPALIYALGDASYGAWLLVMSFVAHLRILDCGMSAGTVKYLAGALARGDRRRLVEVHSASAGVFVAAAGGALLATLALSFVLPAAFPGALRGQGALVLVVGLSAVLDLLVHPQPASLRSRSFYFVPDLIEVATYGVFKVGLVLYLARSGLSIWTLAVLVLAESLVRNALVAGAGLWLCEWTRHASARAIRRDTLRTLATYGAANFLINVGELVRFQLDSAVIGLFLSTAHITVYAVGMRLVSIAYQAVGVIGAISIPTFSALHEVSDAEGYGRALRRTSFWTDLSAGFALANIAVLGKAFLTLWIGKPWVGEAFGVTLVMLPAYLVGLLTGPAAGLMMGAGRLRGLSALTVVEAAANLVLSLALARPLGIYGVCLGTAIPMVIFRGVVFPLVLRAAVGVPVRTYYRCHARGVAISLAYGLLILPFAFVPLRSWLGLVAAGLATAAVFAVLLVVAVPEVRDALSARLGRARARA